MQRQYYQAPPRPESNTLVQPPKIAELPYLEDLQNHSVAPNLPPTPTPVSRVRGEFSSQPPPQMRRFFDAPLSDPSSHKAAVELPGQPIVRPRPGFLQRDNEEEPRMIHHVSPGGPMPTDAFNSPLPSYIRPASPSSTINLGEDGTLTPGRRQQEQNLIPDPPRLPTVGVPTGRDGISRYGDLLTHSLGRMPGEGTVPTVMPQVPGLGHGRESAVVSERVKETPEEKARRLEKEAQKRLRNTM
ncbi:hypothetical protein BDV95DRAFT_600669 [Massariosphaeria phaeospora]|uniref:Pal1 cell morphology protein-domain-containing protein n=1 Tax=Massariosphaeria phaeospora TaxID=100035 RepID=A0A7C8IEZ9_9PLEO|nr:hypothetical protein BDV95DRAFT_600669 [Massariosphaeria phaeospora]